MIRLSASHRFLGSVLALSLLAGCSPIGMATGTGAAVGMASMREGGVKGTANDLRIKALISDKWFKYDTATFAKLNMTVDNGRVLITGVVQDPEDRVEAVRLAWQVEGVTQVINEIRVADSEGVPGYVRDAWVTTRLRTTLTFNRDVRSINYSIETVQGTVYLMGIARNQQELDIVIATARSIPHVKQVISYVRQEDNAAAAPLEQTGGADQVSAEPVGVAPVTVEEIPQGAPNWQ